MSDHILPLAIAIGLPATAVAIASIRYFVKKSKCFTILEQKVKQLTKHDVDSNETHDDFGYRLGEIEKTQATHGAKLDLILASMKLQFKD